MRHAVNGLFGIAIGAFMAWRTGEAKDFYLPGILITLAYVRRCWSLSVAVRRPLVGWIWSRGGQQGQQPTGATTPRLRRTFGWLTLVWAGVVPGQGRVQCGLYGAGSTERPKATIARHRSRIAARLRRPTPLLLALTVWAVRRVTARAARRAAGRRSLGRAQRRRACGPAVGAEHDGADLLLDLGRADEDQLVAGLERVVRGRHEHPLAAQDRDQRGVARQRHVAHRLADVRRGLRQGDLDQVGLALPERHQPDQVADA